MTVLEQLSEQSERAIIDSSGVLAEAFAAGYISIVEMDLNSGLGRVIKSGLDLEIVGQEWPWEKLIQRYLERRAYPPDRDKLLGLTLENLTGGENPFPVELRCLVREHEYDWVQISAFAVSGQAGKLLVTTRVINKERLMRKTLELYVYRNLDYFVLLNAKNNTYKMFSGNQDTPLPPSSGEDYHAIMLEYNKQYVVPEDQEWVISQMSIPHVQAMLEREEMFAFTCGRLNDGQYRRSRVQFVYYDRDAGLILMTRTDVTDVYQEDMQRKHRLATAIRQAQRDALTDLFNQKATADLVARALNGQFRSQAAIFFVDIDNFKLVNDTLGHQRGDELLRYLGRVLAKIAGNDGIAGRIGGDEFLLFLPVPGGSGWMEGYAREVCSALAQSPELAETNLPVSCSVGISVYPRDGTDYHALVQKADQALYSAKRYGKNCYSFYSEEPGADTTA